MADNNSDIILFIGAGFSKPAGVPTMPELVDLFGKRIVDKSEVHKQYYEAVKKLMAEVECIDCSIYNPDLEKLMDILYRLAQIDKSEMSAWKERDELNTFAWFVSWNLETNQPRLLIDFTEPYFDSIWMA